MDNTQEDISLEDVLGAGTLKPAKPTTQAEPIDPATSPFVQKANGLIKKYGFALSAKPPLAKMTDVRGWNSYNMLTRTKGAHSPEEFICKNPQYANYEVVVVGTLGMHRVGYEEDGTDVYVGNICIFDIDAQGVLEQIEAKIGPLPYGYTVYSRPQTAPWKQHRYFRHTAYSIEALTEWGIESAIEYKLKPDDHRARELSLEGRWDLKGSGKGGYVVSAGTPRENDEVYTCSDPKAPFPDIPPALVDLLIQYDREQRRQRKQNSRPRRTNDEEADENPKDRVRSHILSRAKSYANLATRPEDIELLLKHQIEDWAPDGPELVKDPEWIDRIRRYAHRNETGSSEWWYRPRAYRYRPEKKPTPTEPTGAGLILKTPPAAPKLMDALIAAIKVFNRDEAIPIAEVRKRLEAAMKDRVMKFDWRTQRNIVNKARDAAGWTSAAGRYAVWTHKASIQCHSVTGPV
jgi:hypothetical protein